MQYIYTEFKLPSNGQIYPTKTVRLRPKTIFDIKSLLNNPVYMIKQEIDVLQTCIHPDDNVNVYDLVNQDVVYLLYMLRSLSDDTIILKYNNENYPINISGLEIKYLDNWDVERTLPESGIIVELNHKPIKNIFNIVEQRNEFIKKYPDYQGDATNTVNLLNAIRSFNGNVTQDLVRSQMEQLSWKDSIYLIDEIEKLNKLDFGIVEEAKITVDGVVKNIPIELSEQFFRPSL